MISLGLDEMSINIKQLIYYFIVRTRYYFVNNITSLPIKITTDPVVRFKACFRLVFAVEEVEVIDEGIPWH